MLMNTCQMDIGFMGAGDDETVDNAFFDGLSHGVSEKILSHHGGGFIGIVRNGAKDVCKGGIAYLFQRNGRISNDIGGPSIDLFLQL